MELVNILMIGAGRMSEAVISGLEKKLGTSIGKITVTNRADKARLEELQNKYQVHTTTDWEGEIENHQIIILASPPHTQERQLDVLRSRITNQLIITLAAGIGPSYMEKRLPEGIAVAWIMPNTAAQLGMSMSIYACGKFVKDVHRNQINMILHAIGSAEELTEQQVHDLTAITGSAPAFVYSFVQGMEKAAVENGVTPMQARSLVTMMIKGSIAMLEQGNDPEELIAQVASPGGSTAEGLKVLDREGFQETVRNAVNATNEHARSQGEE